MKKYLLSIVFLCSSIFFGCVILGENLVVFQGNIEKSVQTNSICRLVLKQDDKELLNIEVRDAFFIDRLIESKERLYEVSVQCVSRSGEIVAAKKGELGLGGVSKQIVDLGVIARGVINEVELD